MQRTVAFSGEKIALFSVPDLWMIGVQMNSLQLSQNVCEVSG